MFPLLLLSAGTRGFEMRTSPRLLSLILESDGLGNELQPRVTVFDSPGDLHA